MKIISISITNIGLIKQTTIPFNKPLICFYGEIRQGKTTLLNSVKWCLGAKFPQSIISEGEEVGGIRLEFENGHIARDFVRGDDGITKATKIVFVRDGVPLKRPSEEIDKLLNPFMLDQDHLKDMNEIDRQAFFLDLFDVNTAKLDKQFTDAAAEATELRAAIRAYGEIDTTEVLPVDVAALKQQLKEIKAQHKVYLDGINAQIAEIEGKHSDAVAEIDAQNDQIRDYNGKITLAAEVARVELGIADLEQKLAVYRKELAQIKQWRASNLPKEEIVRPEAPDTSELRAKLSVPAKTAAVDKQLAEAQAVQVRVEQYQANLKRAEARDADKAKLLELEAKQRAIKIEKAEKLSAVSKGCGIKGLSFNEAGGLVYEGTPVGTISTSQVMKLSEELSGLYPEGFDLSLIDRTESLGKSIFTFVDRAKKQSRTILATIVGDVPAAVPENIGVFVVEDGNFEPVEVAKSKKAK